MDAACACPVCAQVGTVQWLAEACAYVCCACAAIVSEAPLDAPDGTDAPRAPARPSTSRRWPLAYDREHARAESDRRHHTQVRAMLHGACLRLGWEHAATQARALFERAHAALAPQRAHTRWGAWAAALAAACLYATLRESGYIVDVAAVAVATDQTLAAVVHACGELSREPCLPRVPVHDPGLYWRRHTEYLELHPPAALASVRAIPWPAVRASTEQLYRLCTRYQWASLDAQPFAYAMVMHAIEGTLQRALPVRALADAAPPAIAWDAGDGWLLGPPRGSVASVLARYAELHKMLAQHVQSLPWVAARPVSKKERDRTRHLAPGAPRSVSRADVARYMMDAVHMAAQAPEPSTRPSWTHAFGRAEPARAAPPEARAPMATRLGLSGPQIDALSEAQVDACLFEPDELSTYLRTPEEQAHWERLKGWDVEPAAPRAPAVAPAPKRPRIAPDRAHLTRPLDLAQQTDSAADWDEPG
ncbi:hypothetical protein MCAP1_003471 [Malassezia caprae]|uniref:Uncharacterized protein n=1 Tax=Malassezia caprae TaxID=1381934 RepID=A0AAF0E913_9BASI|nr:hypothetical protein MCAP1_003471 [Malassezia caprae]